MYVVCYVVTQARNVNLYNYVVTRVNLRMYVVTQARKLNLYMWSHKHEKLTYVVHACGQTSTKS